MKRPLARFFLVLAALFIGTEGSLRIWDAADRRWGLRHRLENRLAAGFGDPSELEVMRRYDSVLAYRNTPGYRTSSLTVNSRGFRGDEFSAVKGKNEFRVLCLGDSCTFGWGVGDRETYPSILQELLSERMGGTVTVINAGVPGYSAWQGLMWCREELFALRPDVLVAYLGWNDMFELSQGAGQILSPGEKRKLAFFFRLRVIRLFRETLAWWRASRGRLAVFDPEFRPEFFLHQLEVLRKEAKSRGIRLLVSTLPTSVTAENLSTRGERYPYVANNPARFRGLYGSFDEGIRQVADRRGVGLLDLAASMNGRGAYFADFCHPSAEGNGVIAEKIADQLVPLRE